MSSGLAEESRLKRDTSIAYEYTLGTIKHHYGSNIDLGGQENPPRETHARDNKWDSGGEISTEIANGLFIKDSENKQN